MNLADVLTITLVILGFLIVFNCYWLIAEALFSGFVERARTRYHEHPIRTSLVGALVGVPIFAVGLATAGKGGPLKLVGFICLSAPALAGLLGSTGLVRQIGCGLASPLDEAQPWRRVLRGGIVLACAFVLPFVGWFAVLPLTLTSGVGAFVYAAFADRKASAGAAVNAEPAAEPSPEAAVQPPVDESAGATA